MPHSKIRKLLKSFHLPLFTVSLVIIVLIFVIIISLQSNRDKDSINHFEKPVADNKTAGNNIDIKIDSLLYTFGIDKSWLTTKYKNGSFDKTVLIPKDISTVEINLDLSNLLHEAGYSTIVTEDILTREITVNISGNDTLADKKYGKITVRYSDKLSRNTSVICLVIEDVHKYSEKEIDALLLDKNEFSFLFPRNLDYLDKINKLHSAGKDIIIRFSAGGETSYDSDFTSDFSQKRIRDVIMSFNMDFPWVSNVMLFNEGNVQEDFINTIRQEFSRYNIKVTADTALTEIIPLQNEADLKLITEKINWLISQRKNFICIVKISPDDFNEFYNHILILKKYGHKFYPLPLYLRKINEQNTKHEKQEPKKIVKESKEKK